MNALTCVLSAALLAGWVAATAVTQSPTAGAEEGSAALASNETTKAAEEGSAALASNSTTSGAEEGSAALG